ncbi:MAG: hypothetical protein ACFFB5_13810 [Promethearchaeota archaeon]
MPKVKEVTVNIGVKDVFSISGTFVPNKNEEEAAWELYVELITRITVVKLKKDKGFLREALNSYHSLFKTTRGIMREKGPDLARPKSSSKITLGLIAVSVLNYVLRPLLTEWHPILEDYESTRPKNLSRKAHEDKWENNKDLRDKIAETRETLLHYAQLLADIAKVEPIHIVPAPLT